MVRPRQPPGPIPKEAINFLESKNLKPAFSFTDVWREEHKHSFTVAKVMEKDILFDVQTSLVGALSKGVPFKAWAKDIRPTLDKSGWSAYGKGRTTPNRLRVIYDTNLRSARAVGQWDRIERTSTQRPFLRYALGPSERHRPIHASWSGTTLPITHPFWSDHAPQNGYLCKCHLIQESRTVVRRRGGPSRRAPSRTPRPRYGNKKTSKSELLPRGIDPGFNFNPGRNRSTALKTASDQSEEALKKVETSPIPNTKRKMSSRFRELILEGGRKDSEIFAIVQKEFDLPDSRRSYTSWYRRELVKKGQNPPAKIKEGKVTKPRAAPKPKAEPKPTAPKPLRKKWRLYGRNSYRYSASARQRW